MGSEERCVGLFVLCVDCVWNVYSFFFFLLCVCRRVVVDCGIGGLMCS